MKSLSVRLGVILVIGFSAFVHVEAWGADWKLFDRNDEEIRYYYVQGIKHPSSNMIRVWVKVEYTDKGLVEKVQKLGKNYESLNYTMTQQEINCSERKWRNLSTHDYSKEEKVIYSSSRAGEWKYIERGSMAESLHKAICK